MSKIRCTCGVILLLLPLLLSAAEDNPPFRAISSLVADPSGMSLWALANSRLFHSSDGGSNWKAVRLELPGSSYPTKVWMVQGSAATLFVATNNKGLLRTINEGASWEFTNAGLPTGIGTEDVTPIIGLVSGARSSLSIYVLTETQGVFRSGNNGLIWDGASAGLPVPFFNRTEGSLIAIHPEDPQRVYTLLNIPVTAHRNRTILFGSVDGGQSWAPLKDIPGNFVAASMAVDGMGKLTLTAIDGKTIVLDTPVFLDTSGAALDYVSLLSPAAGGSVFPATSDRDVSNIAVLEDDGSLIYREFDLSGQSLEFQPRGDNTYSVLAVAPQLETDVGSSFVLFDEDARSVSLPFAFPFYSQSWQTMYVNSNGNVSFEKGDRSSLPTIAAVFAGPPRIAPLWADLDPTAGGNVFLKAEAARMVITWKDIPLWHETVPNTYQIVLFADGRIRFNYGTVNAKTGVTGISNGFQRDGNYVVFNGVGSKGLTGLRPLPIVQLFSPPTIDPVRVALRFYESHGDDFDSLVYFAASDYPETLAGGGNAYFARVKNEVRGIGVSLGDFTPLFGSAGRLRGVINMNSLSSYPDAVTDPILDSPASASAVTILGQETTHRFGAFVRFRDAASASAALLGRQAAHWNYFLNSEASVMEGNEWNENGDGTFTATDTFKRYSKLDQYLMGLRGPSEVPPLLLITNPQPLLFGTIGSFVSTFNNTDNAFRDTGKDFGSLDRLKGLRLAIQLSSTSAFATVITHSGQTENGAAPDTISTDVNLKDDLSAKVGQSYQVTKGSTSSSQARYFNDATGKFDGDNLIFRGIRRTVDIADILEVEGTRVPAKGAAPTTYSQAFVLIVPQGKTPKAEDLAKISAIRRAWEPFFKAATDGLGSISTEIKSGMPQITRQILGGGMTSFASRGQASVPAFGYGRLESGTEQATGVAFLTGTSDGRIVTDAAVPATGTWRRARIYVERTQLANTGIALAAPYTAAAVTLQLRNSDGSVASTSVLNLGAGTQVARFANELFPSFNFPSVFRGNVTLTATAPIAIVTLRTAVNETGEFLITTLPVADLDTAPPSTSYITQFTDGAGYGTDIALMNGTSTQITGTVDFRSPQGALVSLRINGTDTSTTRYSIPPDGTQVFSTGAAGGLLQSGYITVRADEGQAGPVARSIISFRQDGKLLAMTGMFPAVSSNRARAFVDMTEGHDSDLAILNDSNRAADVRLTIFDSLGNAVQPSVTVTLQPQAQTAQLVSQLFPRLPRGFRGTVEINSLVPVQLVTLRSTLTGDRFLLAAFPIEPLDISRNERVMFFPYLVDGAGFTSEIFLSNLGTAASAPRLSFTSQAGESLRLLIGQTK